MDRFGVCIPPDGQQFSVARNPKALEELIEQLKGASPKLVVIEATGGLETVVAAAVGAAAMPLAVVNPAQVRHCARALGKRAKTDPVEALVLAHFGRTPTPNRAARPMK